MTGLPTTTVRTSEARDPELEARYSRWDRAGRVPNPEIRSPR
jgi:hypothetical protein